MNETGTKEKAGKIRKPALTNRNKVYYITSYALFTALFCIFAPMSVPIGPIPISLTGLIIYCSIFLIGCQGTMISFVVYLLLGLVGLPVFSGYQGGPAKIVGPTGGYLLGFIFLILIAGLVFDLVKGKARIPLTVAAEAVGTLVLYFFGTVWYCVSTSNSFAAGLTVCVIPFIPFDIAKIAIGTALGLAVRVPLKKAGLIRLK